jgi:hypothetical protein
MLPDLSLLSPREYERAVVAMLSGSVAFQVGVIIATPAGTMIELIPDFEEGPAIGATLAKLLPGAQCHGRWEVVVVGRNEPLVVLRLVIEAATTIRLDLRLEPAGPAVAEHEIEMLRHASEFLLVVAPERGLDNPTVAAPTDREVLDRLAAQLF